MSVDLYPNSYFKQRFLNDATRIKSFNKEKLFIQKFVSIDKKKICDVGCSTGEFLKYINWNGPKYGMEINIKAMNQAKKNGIKFNKNILNKKNFFDVVIFRGTIQHLDDPFNYLIYAHRSLKKDGLLFFLATPNINSFHYKLFNDLPALDAKRNYYLPSDISIKNLMNILGFKFIDCEYPYFNSGYDKPLFNYFCILLKVLKIYKKNIPFPGNMMNMVFKK